MQFTRIAGAHSIAIDSVSWATPAFAAQYAARPDCGIRYGRATTDVTLMIEPRPRSSIAGATHCAAYNDDFRLKRMQ